MRTSSDHRFSVWTARGTGSYGSWRRAVAAAGWIAGGSGHTIAITNDETGQRWDVLPSGMVSDPRSSTAVPSPERSSSMPIDRTTEHDLPPDDALVADVASTMENRGENWKARVVLTKIPNAQRRVIELIYLEHLSLARVAERLGISIQTAEARCLEGIGRMRRDLDGLREASQT
jgi:hypothetical protein